jgi:hypothetical protein
VTPRQARFLPFVLITFVKHSNIGVEPAGGFAKEAIICDLDVTPKIAGLFKKKMSMPSVSIIDAMSVHYIQVNKIK